MKESGAGGGMRLYELVDPHVLEQHLKDGLVGTQKHPTLPLIIYNYTQKAQFGGVWGDGTIDYCRGLIVCNADNDMCYRIISRPFKKFHNLNTVGIPETLEENIPKTAPAILTKLDGSLGILWQYEGEYGIATRGSFTSPQAQWATAWLKKQVADGSIKLPPSYSGLTWLFEIIYDENRIVVEYPFEGLVLLAVLDNGTGVELSYDNLETAAQAYGFRLVGQITGRSIYDCMADNIPNKEGYVVSYGDNLKEPLKVKIKMADYVRLHKILTSMNPRSVWELLSAGKGIDGFDSAPDHFKKWLQAWRTRLLDEYSRIYKEASAAYDARPFLSNDISDREARKQHALYIQNLPQHLHSVLFTMLDNGDVAPAIWKQIKPRGDDKTFRQEGE